MLYQGTYQRDASTIHLRLQGQNTPEDVSVVYTFEWEAYTFHTVIMGISLNHLE